LLNRRDDRCGACRRAACCSDARIEADAPYFRRMQRVNEPTSRSVRVGAVAIGRNEGERLARCLESLQPAVDRIVYVDSGSQDGSVARALRLGIDVVELDAARPFSAARARNAGVRRLRELEPGLELVQLIDGDCVLAPGWIEAACRFLSAEPGAAVACGRLREVHPEASVYNWLIDLEWDTPVGDVPGCGGICMVRADAFAEVGGFNEALVAGEEPELCLRLRRTGRRIVRLPFEMAGHDAALTRFSQWWRRRVRAGHAVAQSAHLHRGSSERYCVRELLSSLVWGAALPLLALLVAAFSLRASAALLALYAIPLFRSYRAQRRRGRPVSAAALNALDCVVGKLAELQGNLLFAARLWTGRNATAIEYKLSAPSAGSAPEGVSVDAPLRIAYLTTAYPEVSHTFIRREILELARRGHEVLRIAIRRPTSELVDPLDRAERERTRYVLASPPAVLGSTLAEALRSPPAFLRAARATLAMSRRSERGLLRHLAYLAEACHVRRLLERERAQHLHVHFGTNAAAVGRLTRLLGGPPYSVTVHGPDEFDAPLGLSLADKVAESAFTVAISHFCAAQLRRWVSADHWDRIRLARCSVDAEFIREPRPIPEGCTRLVCVGRLSSQKAQLLLVEAASRLAAEGRDFELVLAGGGELRDVIEARIAKQGIEERVRVTGWLSAERVRELLQESRALVLASSAEGLPVVIMEAFALGRPVVSSMVGGIAELVEPGKSGWLVPSGDLEALLGALRAALDAPLARLEEMGRSGRERVLLQHSTAAEVDKLEDWMRRSAELGA
jgi:colanic acid/amylovoran biosynthesis glycosyltransferase